MTESSLGIFLKVPRAGRVKTRLVPRLGEGLAASLYTALLEDTVTLASRAAPRQLILFVAGGRAVQALAPAVLSSLREGPGPELHEIRQVNGDLGRRLDAAFAAGEEIGAQPLLMLGSDSPDLPAAHLQRALDCLDGGVDVILGPVSDGGVWCIGLRRPFAGFFADLPWSSAETGQALRNRAGELGLKTEVVDPWYDCDEPDDLDRLRRRLEEEPERAPATWAWLQDRLPSSSSETP